MIGIHLTLDSFYHQTKEIIKVMQGISISMNSPMPLLQEWIADRMVNTKVITMVIYSINKLVSKYLLHDDANYTKIS